MEKLKKRKRAEYFVRLQDSPDHKPQPLDVLVGGRDESTRGKFVPNINMSKWDDEAFLNINFPEQIAGEKETETDGKIGLAVGDRTHQIYLTEEGIEYEIEFQKKPKENVLEFDLTFPEGLSFYYQWDLEESWIRESENETKAVFGATTFEEYRKTVERPEKVEKSYAVYWKCNNRKYKTGKFCHIYRPKLIDAEGIERWAEMWIDPPAKKLYIECDFKGLKFPVRLDPTIGYEGTQDSTFASTGAFALFYQDQAPSAGGTGAGTFSCYCQNHGGDNFRGAMYGGDASSESTCSSKSAITDASSEGTAPFGSASWQDVSVTFNSAITANYWYYLCCWWEASVYFRYDDGVKQGCYKANTYSSSLPTMSGLSNHDRIYAWHFDYPEAAADDVNLGADGISSLTGSASLDVERNLSASGPVSSLVGFAWLRLDDWVINEFFADPADGYNHTWNLTSSGGASFNPKADMEGTYLPQGLGSKCIEYKTTGDWTRMTWPSTIQTNGGPFYARVYTRFASDFDNGTSISIISSDSFIPQLHAGKTGGVRYFKITIYTHLGSAAAEDFSPSWTVGTWYRHEFYFEGGAPSGTVSFYWRVFSVGPGNTETLFHTYAYHLLNGPGWSSYNINMFRITMGVLSESDIQYAGIGLSLNDWCGWSGTLEDPEWVYLDMYENPVDGPWSNETSKTYYAKGSGGITQYAYTMTEDAEWDSKFRFLDSGMSILSVRVVAYAKDRYGGREFSVGLYIDSTEYFAGDPHGLTFEVWSDDYTYGYGQWDVNPSTGLAWTVGDLEDLTVRLKTSDDWDADLSPHRDLQESGGQVGELYMALLLGSADAAFLTNGVRFGAPTDSSIKVWSRTNRAAAVKIKYATTQQALTDEDSSGSGVMETAEYVTSSDDDYCVTIPITGLSPITTYYIDVFVDGRSTYEMETAGGSETWNPWNTLPRFTTFPQYGTFYAGTFCAAGDDHEGPYGKEICESIAGKSPAFLLKLGDEQTSHVPILDLTTECATRATSIKSIRQYYKNRRGAQIPNRHHALALDWSVPIIRVVSDHDWGADNSTKHGHIPRGQLQDDSRLLWRKEQAGYQYRVTRIDLNTAHATYGNCLRVWRGTTPVGSSNTRYYSNTDFFMVKISHSSAGNDGWYLGEVKFETAADGTYIELTPSLAVDEPSLDTNGDEGYPRGVVIDIYQWKTFEAIKGWKEWNPEFPYIFPDPITGTASGGSSTTLQCTTTPERQVNAAGWTGGTPTARTITNGALVAGDRCEWGSSWEYSGEVVYYNSLDNVIVVELDNNEDPLLTTDAIRQEGGAGWSTSGEHSAVYYFPIESKYGVYKGMVLWYFEDTNYSHTSNPIMTFVQSNNGTTVTLARELRMGPSTNEAESFGVGTKYFKIQRWAQSREWWYGTSYFYSIDIRAKADMEAIETRGLVGNDPLDGTREEVDPKFSGMSSSYAQYKLNYATGGFVSNTGNDAINNVVEGDVVINKDMFRFTTAVNRNLGTLVAGDEIEWGDSSGNGGYGKVISVGIDDKGGPELTILRTSGSGDPECGDQIYKDAANYQYVSGSIRNVGGVVKIHTTAGAYQEYVNDTNFSIELEWGSGTDFDLFPDEGSQSFEIYESGGSDHMQQGDTTVRAKIRNEKAGHIQREDFIYKMNHAERDWGFFVCETPFYGVAEDVPGNQYQLWPTFDPICQCSKNYLIEKLNYAYLFGIGSDQHFAALADGLNPEINTRFACFNVAPLYGKYAYAITHAPSRFEWTVAAEEGSSGAEHRYAAWGRDWLTQSQILNTGAFAKVDMIDRQTLKVGLYGPDGTLINNDELIETFTVTEMSLGGRRLRQAPGNARRGDIVYVHDAESAAYGKQFPISSTTVVYIYLSIDAESQGLAIGDAYQVRRRHWILDNPTDEGDSSGTWELTAAADPLGELEMTVSSGVFGMCSESRTLIVEEGFEDSSGVIDVEWDEVID